MILIGNSILMSSGWGGRRRHLTGRPGAPRIPAGSLARPRAVASGSGMRAGAGCRRALRQAAAWAGVGGLRPTYGTVPVSGSTHLFLDGSDRCGWSRYHGLRGNLNIISTRSRGSDIYGNRPDQYRRAGTAGLSGLQIGFPRSFWTQRIRGWESVMSAMDLLRAGGAGVETFSMPELKHAVTAFAVISRAEASANLSRLDGIKYGYRSPGARSLSEVYEMSRSEGFGDHVKESVMLGNYFLSQGKYEAYYLKSLQVKALLAESFRAAFGRFDLIISRDIGGPFGRTDR